MSSYFHLSRIYCKRNSRCTTSSSNWVHMPLQMPLAWVLHNMSDLCYFQVITVNLHYKKMPSINSPRNVQSVFIDFPSLRNGTVPHAICLFHCHWWRRLRKVFYNSWTSGETGEGRFRLGLSTLRRCVIRLCSLCSHEDILPRWLCCSLSKAQ